MAAAAGEAGARVTGRRLWLVAAAVIAIAVLGAVTRNQLKVRRARQARADLQQQRQAEPATDAARRQALFDLLQPVALANCQLERFGEANDGGYLMCANLLGGVQAGYSYGISGYDQWGCDLSTRLKVAVHQYDCFDTTRPACPTGETIFHAECVGEAAGLLDGRSFDTVSRQLAANGDQSRRVALKMDVEGAEWRSLLVAPDDLLARIDQLAIEFHWAQDDQGFWRHEALHLAVIERLKQFFEIAHLHFNNASCIEGLEPFPTWAYEVLFVNKRLAVVDPAGKVTAPHPLDAPNIPSMPDCQPPSRVSINNRPRQAKP